jgi:hypothetical protein
LSQAHLVRDGGPLVAVVCAGSREGDEAGLSTGRALVLTGLMRSQLVLECESGVYVAALELGCIAPICELTYEVENPLMLSLEHLDKDGLGG